MLQAESLAKKYEEKYKQVAEIASKLTIEEAKYRDVQVKVHISELLALCLNSFMYFLQFFNSIY